MKSNMFSRLLLNALSGFEEPETWRILVMDHSAVDMALRLCQTDWREWLPAARSPFLRCAIEMPLAGFHHKSHKRVLILMKDGLGQFVNELESGEMTASPFLVNPMQDELVYFERMKRLTNDEAFHDKMGQIADLGWGEDYVKDFGTPEFVTVAANPLTVWHDMDGPFDIDYCLKRARAFEGQVRFCMAALALISTIRAEVIPPTARRGTRFARGLGSIPHFMDVDIFIRPNAPRLIKQRVKASQPTGIHLPLHDVRGHWRTLDYRPNSHWEEYHDPHANRTRYRRWIADHTSGDERYGVRRHTYIVENMPEGPTDE